MLRVFIDTSVLFAAAYSSTGFAHDLIRLALEGKISTVVSQDVLDEIGRNIPKKAPAKLSDYQILLNNLDPEIIPSPDRSAIQIAAQYTDAKDAPIIAAAITAKPDYFVTYDRKHLLEPPEVAAKSGLKIVTPDFVVQLIHSQEE